MTTTGPDARTVDAEPRATEPEAAPTPRAPRPSWHRRVRSLRTFDSLRIPAFRDFFISMLGQMASMNMQMVVRSFLAYQLTGSYAALGTVALASAVPGMTFSMVGGVIADRVPRRTLVIQCGQAANALNTMGIALLLATGQLTFGLLVIASVLQGTAMALMMPSRQALLPMLVGGDQLMNAVALNSAGMNTMRLFAPALGGFLFEWTGAASVYFLMSGLYLFACAFLVRVPEERRETSSAGSAAGEVRVGLANIREGIAYIIRDPIMGPLMGINILVVITAMPYMFLLAGFVQDVLDSGADSLGFLQSVSGIGALSGALVIASLPARHRGAGYLLGAAFQGVMLFLAFTVSTSVVMMAGFMLAMGVGQSARQALSNVLVQTYVDDVYRGRVMSVYMLQFSLAQLGAFLTGILASAFGPRVALGATSMLLVALALGALAFIPRLRRLQ